MKTGTTGQIGSMRCSAGNGEYLDPGVWRKLHNECHGMGRTCGTKKGVEERLYIIDGKARRNESTAKAKT